MFIIQRLTVGSRTTLLNSTDVANHTANFCRIDVEANTLDFWLNATRDVEAALLIIPSRSQRLTKAYLLSIL